MIDFSDNRKWTERRIAKYSFISGLIIFMLNLGVSVYFSCQSNKLVTEANGLVAKANSISKSALCVNLVQPKLDTLSEHLYEMPRLISGCALRPKDYCREARKILGKAKELSAFVISTLAKDKEQLEQLQSSLIEIDHLFNENIRDRKQYLIKYAADMNVIRRELKLINLKNISCI